MQHNCKGEIYNVTDVKAIVRLKGGAIGGGVWYRFEVIM